MIDEFNPHDPKEPSAAEQAIAPEETTKEPAPDDTPAAADVVESPEEAPAPKPKPKRKPKPKPKVEEVPEKTTKAEPVVDRPVEEEPKPKADKLIKVRVLKNLLHDGSRFRARGEVIKLTERQIRNVGEDTVERL